MVQKTHKGVDSQREQGQGRSLWNYCVRDTREKMCIVEHRQEEPSGGSHQPVPALVWVRLGNLMGDLQWIAVGRGREP